MKRLADTAIAVATIAFTTIVTGFGNVALAHEAGDIILRVGAAQVAPDESSSVVTTTATGPLAATAVGVEDNTQLGLNLVWMWTDSIALEVLAATPFDHDLRVSGLSQYGFSTTDLGSTKHLPPTLSALYFFGNANSMIRPYIGAGVNYTTFFSEETQGPLAGTDLSLGDSWGLGGQIGFDVMLNDQWFLNLDARYISIESKAKLDGASLGKVEINPWVYGAHIGFRF